MFSSDFGTTGGGGGFNMDTPGSSQENKGAPRRNFGLSMVPVLIADLLNEIQPDGTLILEGQDVSSVLIVGMVRSVDIQSLNYKYIIDDLSGANIEVLQWLEGRDESDGFDQPPPPPEPPLMTNAYARICGAIRKTGDKLFVVAFKATRLTDLNLLTMHLLETVHCRRVARGIKNPSGPGAIKLPNVGDSMPMDTTSGAKARAGGNPAFYGLNREQLLVAEIVDTFRDDVGCPLQTILDSVKLPHTEIRKALKFMSDEGHLYTTVDDDHYKMTSD